MDAGGIAGDRLRSFVERYEWLQEEADALSDDKGELLKEVEGNGFDKKVFKIVIKRRRMGKDQCDEEDTLVELYERALEEEPPEPRAGAGDARARETAVQDAVADFVRDVPDDTTVSIATSDGKGFAVTNKGGVRTVRQFGEAGPEPTEPFAAGKAAALAGLDETSDPYPHPSIESADWLRGHAEGLREREAARAGAGKRRRRQASGPEGAEATV